jgi:hypothetical protein
LVFCFALLFPEKGPPFFAYQPYYAKIGGKGRDSDLSKRDLSQGFYISASIQISTIQTPHPFSFFHLLIGVQVSPIRSAQHHQIPRLLPTTFIAAGGTHPFNDATA